MTEKTLFSRCLDERRALQHRNEGGQEEGGQEEGKNQVKGEP